MKANENFTFRESENIYIIRLKKRRLVFLWWLLLLLLPLLLLIRLHKDVYIQIKDTSGNKLISTALIGFSYTDYSILTGSTPINLSDTSDNEGIARFENVSYTIYSYLFKPLTKARITASDSCYQADSLEVLFHKFKHKDIKIINLPIKTCSLVLQVIDKDSGEPLPDAEVVVKTNFDNITDEFKLKSDVNGNVTIDKAPVCGQLSAKATLYGFLPDSLSESVKDIITKRSDNLLKLSPGKGMVTFFVKDLKTKEFIPGATATLTINGKKSIVVKTNTNGVGAGSFDSVLLVAKAEILVQKSYYFDTSATFTVEKFVKGTNEERTFYLRPATQSVTFRDIHGKTGQPLQGVKNEIFINGKMFGEPVFSNANGVFTVAGITADSKISIVASKSEFVTNSTKIKNLIFKDVLASPQNSRDIPLNSVAPPPPPVDDEFKGKGGDLRINLQWKTFDDLDLFVTDPCGKIVWALELTQGCNGGVGILDVDANTNRYPRSTWTRNAQENAYWKSPSKGKYIIKVEHCIKQDESKPDPVSFNITIIDNGKRTDFKGTIREKQKNYVTTYEVK